MKIISLTLSAVLLSACNGGNPRPQPRSRPTETPIATIVPTSTPDVPIPPVVSPTPYPTPEIDLKPFLHEQGGRVVDITIQPGEDAGEIINKADSFDGPGKLIIRSGSQPASIKTNITLKHDSDWHGEFKCDVETPWQGCVLLEDNTKPEGKGMPVIHEPEAIVDGQPTITVFQSKASAVANEAKAENITVRGFHIKGRQTMTDGGTRQAISLGNCVNCAGLDNKLEGIASIGLQLGGSSAHGNHALNGVFTGNTISGMPAAAIAIVNCSGCYVFRNRTSKPGRRGGPGGVSGIDIETNNFDDWAENLWIFGNDIDHDGAAFSSIGSGILAQQRGSSRSGGLRILSNRITCTLPDAGLTSGLFISGSFPGAIVANNYVQRAMQAGIQAYGARDMLFQDNVLNTVGGGGSPAILLIDCHNNRFTRVRILADPLLGGSSSGEIREEGSSGNVFE